MSTIRRGLIGILTLTATFSICALALAADPPADEQRPPGAPLMTKGIAKVTDGQGHPLDLKRSAIATDALGMVRGSDESTVRRGRAWWPYASGMPPYRQFGKPVEEMTEDEIVVNANTLDVKDPSATLKNAPRELLLEPNSQLTGLEGFYLVKIKGFSRNQEQVDALQNAGAVLGEYLNVNTYVAKIRSSDFAAVKALPFVAHIADYQPAYKISPRIGLEDVPVDEAVDSVTGQAKPWVFELTLHAGVDVFEVQRELDHLRIFPNDEDIVSNEALTVIMIRANPQAVPALAQIPGVKWIAEKTYPKLDASSTSPATIPMMLQNNAVFTTTTGVGWKLWNNGIDGTGQIVTVMDSGLNTKMFHFAQDTLNNGTVGPAHRKVVGYDAFGGGDQCVLDNLGADGGHGAKTSQHAVGSISNMTANQDLVHTPNVHWDNGIARGAKLYFQDVGPSGGGISPPLDLGPSITTAIGKGSFIQNHSWGAATNAYDTAASLLDTALFNNPNFVATVSAGNRGAAGTGTLGSPGTAKNCISVGGNDVANPNNLFIDCAWAAPAGTCDANDLGSSRGPVSGLGRKKPDIMSYIWATSSVGGERMAFDAPTAMCQTDVTKTPYFNYTNIGNEGGTSFAAPDVAGLAALVRDYFIDGFYPTGSATPANTVTPVGSLIKAVILASGEDMAATAFPQGTAIIDRYSSDVGYGRANLPGALHIGPGAPFLWVQNNDNVGDGATKTFFYNINGNSLPLRVMMVYYDSAGDALQKDADLKVTIGASTYWGNNFSAGWSTTATTTRDHTNPTEGVFLDAAHGLPASGTVRVDVIGFNNPGGMNYSLVVVGDVASQTVTQVALDKGKYNCDDTVNITVNDVAATSPVSVTLVSKNNASTTIDTEIISCTGSNGVFTGSIATGGSGIVVADLGTLTATYVGAIAPVTVNVSCQLAVTDAGSALAGGCDNSAAGTDEVGGPLFNGNSNEFYSKYMDAGEYSSYTFSFTNRTGFELTDVDVSLSFSGAGASKMTALNGPIHIGTVPADAVVGAVFQVFTDPTTTGLTAVNMDFDLTSVDDGYTVPKRITQVQLLQTNDTVQRLAVCAAFNTSISPFFPSTAVTGRLQNSWKWVGSASSPSTVGSELRVDGSCGSATANAAAMVGNSGTAPSTTNFANNVDSFLYINFQPALRGNGPSSQPYHFSWKWHSFYVSSESVTDPITQGGVWGAFYNQQWNSSTGPTGDQLRMFPVALAYFHASSVFDYVSTWNWDAANGGIPDDPLLHPSPAEGGAPNQIIITFSESRGLSTAGTWFSYGHEHADLWWFTDPQTHGTHRDIAFDNDRLVYDIFDARAQAGASCGGGGQLGQVAFDLSDYTTCPTGTAVVSILDADAAPGQTVTVSSPGTLDVEIVSLSLMSAPYHAGTITLSTVSGSEPGDGILFVLPNETITVSYTDTSPAGVTIATADTACAGGNVIYLANAQFSDNGDNDGIADNNETVTVDITVQNNLAIPLTNAKVKIFADSPNVDCISDSEALYGTIGAGGSATNPGGDRFTFHVTPAVDCTDVQNPPTASFIVVITGDGLDGAATLQRFTISLDQDATGSGFTYTQNFNVDPGWATGVTPDDSGPASCGSFLNDFHWCAACGNGNGGYGAWTGNSPFGTSGQNYRDVSSSTLYSPSFVANGAVTLQFRLAYRTEDVYDGALVQYQLGPGSWTDSAFSTPAQAVTSSEDFCSPYGTSRPNVWTGDGTLYTLTNAASVPASLGQSIQFRWRLGGDSAFEGTTYGGLGVDDVTVTNLREMICEPTLNTGLPPCAFSCTTSPDGTPCDDGSGCTINDQCTSSVCGGTPITAPPEVAGVAVAANKTTYSWTPVSGATNYDVVRGTLSALPVGPGGGDETCIPDLAGPSLIDGTLPAPGTGFFYLPRAANTCGNGTYGTQSNLTPRVSSTCP